MALFESTVTRGTRCIDATCGWTAKARTEEGLVRASRQGFTGASQATDGKEDEHFAALQLGWRQLLIGLSSAYHGIKTGSAPLLAAISARPFAGRGTVRSPGCRYPA